MSFQDLIDNLIPSDMLPSEKDYIVLYKKSLEYLNTLQYSRFNAMYFGSMLIGNDFFSYKDIHEFGLKYCAACLYVMNDLYNRYSSDTHQLTETSLSILYSMLASYVGMTDYTDKELEDLLEENDKFSSEKVEAEFSKEGDE